jgi:molybdopterin-containing oxidoreductase family iron-sulfur binding subunit
MEENNKIYWKGIEQLTNDPEFVKYAEKEFPEYLKIKDAYGDNTEDNETGTTRRDFLKLMGFSVAAVSLAACEASVKHAIPYLNKPETIDPSIPNYYASTYVENGEALPVVVKTREGRPIFVEGNALSKFTKGGTNARVNASVLSLYDIEKAKNPSVKDGDGRKEVSWETIDAEIINKLKGASQIRIVANTIVSPSTKKVIAEFATKYGADKVKLVQYDSISRYAIVEAHKRTKGKAVLPSYDFSKAKTVVSIGADFLASWVSDVEHTKQFSQTRKIGKIGNDSKDMSRLFVFESIMSLTGSSADYRTPIKPSQTANVVAKLFNLVAAKTGKTAISVEGTEVKYLSKAADELVANAGKSLVVAGSNDPNIQVLVNGINEMLGNYGQTIDTEVAYSYQKQGNDADMANFIQEVANGSVNAVIFYNCNPVYDHPLGATLATALPKVSLTVATGDRIDETSSLCQYHTPDTHYLESWGDAEIKRGFFSLMQPTIGKIFNTRQVQESLLKWSESSASYKGIIEEYWKTVLMPLQTKEATFEEFWFRSLHNGVFEPTLPATYVSEHDKNVAPATPVTAFDYNSATAEFGKYKEAKFELVIMENTVLGSGSQANNPYLQETPEPISKVCWGNFVAVSQADAKELNLVHYEGLTPKAKVNIGGKDLTLQVVVQPGQPKGVIAISLGYGRAEYVGKVAKEAGGVNMYPFLQVDGAVRNLRFDVTIADAGEGRSKIAQTQTHQTFMGRETIIQESILAKYQKDEAAGRYLPKISTAKGKVSPQSLSAWDIKSDGYGDKHGENHKPMDKETEEANKNLFSNRHPLGSTADVHTYKNHHWGLVIDLNSCTGCSACVVACHVENNVPIVGTTEIIRRREMHWMRIDRYYSSIVPTTSKDYDALEQAAENPEVVFQPMMCQHCNNAPCETVCPVAATTHSSEGLNQMAYNRCIGTKYCANNCPYKVRRFNWFKYFNNTDFDYHMNTDLGKMVLNPDVTVRSRGVMEKCSMCVQRIQAGKLKAKMEQRPLQDGEIVTACMSACPADAIIFGDLNNPESRISKVLDYEYDKRAYNVLAEINTRPNVWYLTKIRNKDEEKTQA